MQNFINNLIDKKEYDFGITLSDIQKEKYSNYCHFLVNSVNEIDKPQNQGEFKSIIKTIWSEMLHNHSAIDIIIKKYYKPNTKEMYKLFSIDDYKMYIADICMYIAKDNETKFVK